MVTHFVLFPMDSKDTINNTNIHLDTNGFSFFKLDFLDLMYSQIEFCPVKTYVGVIV